MKILLVDVSSVFHRAYNSLSTKIPNATDSEGNPSIGTYGFLSSFFKACKEFGNFTHYLFALDVKNSTSARTLISSEYKGNREKKDNSFYKDKDNLVNNILPMLDILPLGMQGYEADDIIASSCRYVSENYAGINYEVYIMSGDRDLEQTSVYSPNIHFIKTQPKWELVSNSKILEKWGNIDPKDIPLIKAISGDSSDNIMGIRGYRTKKALQVYKNLEFLDQHREIIEKNLSLIKLKDNLDAVPRTVNITMEKLEKVFNLLNSPTLLKRKNKILELFANN